jgi:hypothetical protein
MNWYTLPGLPSDLLTSDKVGVRRVKVENGSDLFNAGRAFRLPYEYSVGATPVVLRFIAPVNFNLTLQLLTCDIGNIKLDAYRGGTEGGTWTDVPAYARNLVSINGYTRQIAIATGGTLTPTGPSVDKIRLRTSNSTAQKSNVSGGLDSTRRLTAGTYYLVLSVIDGNETAQGIYLIEWEELGE